MESKFNNTFEINNMKFVKAGNKWICVNFPNLRPLTQKDVDDIKKSLSVMVFNKGVEND